MQLVVDIPETPHRYLSPNRKTGTTAQARKRLIMAHAAKAKKAREKAKEQTEATGFVGFWRQEMTDTAPSGTYELQWMIAWEKGHRIVDETNLIAMLKPYEDGVADALGVNDVRFRPTIHSQYRDPEGKGYLRLIITPI